MSISNLNQLRKLRDRSQGEVAAALRLSQSAISKLERRADVSLRVLRAYATALGGSVDVVVRFPDGDVRLEVPAGALSGRMSLRRRTERGVELPEGWEHEVERIRGLTPEERMQELAEISSLYASVGRKP